MTNYTRKGPQLGNMHKTHICTHMHTYAHRLTDGVRSVAFCPAARKAARVLLLYEKIEKGTKKEKNKLCPSFLTFCQFLEHKKDRK